MELIYSEFEVLFGYLIKDCTPNFKEIFSTKTKKTMRTESMFTMEKCYGANEIFHPFSFVIEIDTGFVDALAAFVHT